MKAVVLQVLQDRVLVIPRDPVSAPAEVRSGIWVAFGSGLSGLLPFPKLGEEGSLEKTPNHPHPWWFDPTNGEWP